MSTEEEQYERWLEHVTPEEATLLREQATSIEELHDAFYRELSFGTAGLRGIIGLGPNRMNVYTVAKATQGLADYLNAHYESPSAAIARDSRNRGEEFVRAAAGVLAANGVVAHVYRAIQPTPVLSFTVRELGCSAGINVTASHNPAAYNGYKVYGDDGCQIASQAAVEIQEGIDGLDFFDDVKRMDFEEALAAGLVQWVDDAVVDRFLDEVAAQSVKPEDARATRKLRIVYTPLNGTGLECVTRILKRVGLDDLSVVDEQGYPDGNFTTCPYPNPEIREALEVGLRYCNEVKPDLLLATDPDCDRVGIAVPDGNGGYALFSGNEVGALLLEYICQQRIKKGTMPENPIAVKTIVTTDIVNLIGKEYGVEIINVLTGFKFIGEQIGLLEAKGEEKRYIWGFEESYGYLSGSYVRDKDAVDASMLICEMAAYYRTQGITLLQARENMYKKYGFFYQTLYSFTFEGASGMKKMADIMENLRNAHPTEIAGLKVIRFDDYKLSTSKNVVTGEVTELTLPKSNVLAFFLEGGSKVIVRPSGTEPKVKAYITSKQDTREEAEAIEQKIYADFSKNME